jgi:hypothetical protein
MPQAACSSRISRELARQHGRFACACPILSGTGRRVDLHVSDILRPAGAMREWRWKGPPAENVRVSSVEDVRKLPEARIRKLLESDLLPIWLEFAQGRPKDAKDIPGATAGREPVWVR